MKAIWNGKIIAESNETEVVEGNHYFPPASIKNEFLKDTSTTSICPWKGTALYYDVIVDKDTNKDAAWYYPNPSDAAKNIKNYVAFWKGVEVIE